MEKALFRVARRWIAGSDLQQALKAANHAYGQNRHVVINRLGEYHTSKRQIARTVSEYIQIISSLRQMGIRGGISVKPTQIGLSISQRECVRNLTDIISSAAKSHIFVWVDMESSDHTDETLEMYNALFARYERLGIAVQANLKRSGHDIDDLLGVGAKVRLVKGAYSENGGIAYRTKEKIDARYTTLLETLFRSGNEFAVATHDHSMILKAKKLSKQHQRKFEFQFLRGIRDDIKPQLIREKFVVTDYIPYGNDWLSYSIRRIRERKRNILLLGSSLLQSHTV